MHVGSTADRAVHAHDPDSLRTVRISDPLELADADTPEALEALKGHCHD